VIEDIFRRFPAAFRGASGSVAPLRFVVYAVTDPGADVNAGSIPAWSIALFGMARPYSRKGE
jgi:hypothetical protein